MAIFNIDYKQFLQNLLPAQWRQGARHTGLLNCFLFPLQWLHDWWYDSYIYSQNYYYFDGTVLYENIGITYDITTNSYSVPVPYNIINPPIANKGDNIRFADNGLWQCQKDNVNCISDNPKTNSASINWYRLQIDFVGLFDRMKFNARKVILEYVLNLYFNPKGYNYLNGTFGRYNIFIENNKNISASYIYDKSFLGGVFIYDKGKNGSDFWVWDIADSFLNICYTIYIPAQIATDLGSDYVNIIKALADKYNFLSVNYSIILY